MSRASLKKAFPEFSRLRTPAAIQDFLDALPINHEKKKETCRSARSALSAGNAHCLEGAFIAAAALQAQGRKPLLMNLKAGNGDEDHAVALFRERGRWGALSKTNHAVLRYRDPVYKTLRELALSYFHEYFLNDTGRKTLRAYSAPFDLTRYGESWQTGTRDQWKVAYALRASPHEALVSSADARRLRRASAIERAAGRLTEWKKRDKRT